MGLEVAELVAGSETPAGDGITGALRCVLSFPTGDKKAAILKRGPIDQVAAEAFAALLLHEWGLPVPQPCLVIEAGGVAFASIDTGYPNLKHHTGLDSLPEGPAKDAAIKTAMSLVLSFPTTPLATACDEAIDNRDRNLGNVLWDGSKESWIDHALSFGVGAGMQDVNKLCVMAVASDKKDDLHRSSVAQALILDRSAISVAETEMASSPVPPGQMAAFVASRVSNLATRLLDRFPAPADLLSPPK